MDTVERQVPDLESAQRVLDRYIPEHFDLLLSWRQQTLELFGSEWFDLIARAVDAIAICLARIVLRHGSAADLHRCFHDEVHPYDLMRRLRRLYKCAPSSLDEFDYIVLAIFAAGHDLRQDLSGLHSDSVGRNERASAEETGRILKAVGLDPENHAVMHAALRRMIDGTTFHSRPFVFHGRKYQGGVIAPALAEYLREHPDTTSGERVDSRQIDRILLATDIDTGNVADPFELFVDRGVRLCRERFAVSGQLKLDTKTAIGVYQFLTAGQERYFFMLQRFHASATRQCFQPDKEANGVKLEALTAAMRDRWDAVLSRSVHDVTGEQVIGSYIELAETV